MVSYSEDPGASPPLPDRPTPIPSHPSPPLDPTLLCCAPAGHMVNLGGLSGDINTPSPKPPAAGGDRGPYTGVRVVAGGLVAVLGKSCHLFGDVGGGQMFVGSIVGEVCGAGICHHHIHTMYKHIHYTWTLCCVCKHHYITTLPQYLYSTCTVNSQRPIDAYGDLCDFIFPHPF